jgi:hypothetical protein
MHLKLKEINFFKLETLGVTLQNGKAHGVTRALIGLKEGNGLSKKE